MARILLSNNTKDKYLKFNLESMGYKVSYTDYNHGKLVKSIKEELKADLFLMNVEPEFFKDVDLDDVTSRIFHFNIPVIPVINYTDNYYETPVIKHVSAISPYGYVMKHHKKPYNMDELKFAIEVALYKHQITNTKNSPSNKTEEALKESEEKFRTFIQQSLDGIVLLDEKGYVIEWNKGNEVITGIKKEDALGRRYWEIKQELTPPERATPQHLKHVQKLQLEALESGEAPFLGKIHEIDILRPNGERYYIEQVAFPIKTNKGYRIGYVTRDITQRKQIEEALKKRIIALSQPLYNKKEISFCDLFNLKDIQKIQDLFSEATGVASIITQPDGTPITQPSNFRRLCSDIIRKTNVGLENCYKSDALIGRHHPEGPVVMPCLSCGLWDAGASISVGGKHIANWLIGQVRNETQNEEQMRSYAREIGADENDYIKAFHEVPLMSEAQLKRIAKVLFAFANQLSDVAYQNVQQARFITERENAEKDLEKSLHEKEVLLREIHHRVKNNMQIISSLLNLQSQHVDETETMDVLKESQGRVRSMAMIHENLYQSPSLTRIDFKNYIEKLTSNIFYTYGVGNQDIEMIFDVEDVEMNIDTAIPCGLIINEVVTNSLKYAFPPANESSGIRGTIKIELKETGDYFKLEISDDGVGIPSNVNPKNTETLGLMLVNSLVKQMEGTLKIDVALGTRFTIDFKELKYKKRI